jgi:hypothetical protein
MLPKTIDEVISRLDEIIQQTIQDENPLGDLQHYITG